LSSQRIDAVFVRAKLKIDLRERRWRRTFQAWFAAAEIASRFSAAPSFRGERSRPALLALTAAKSVA
jgi:hypothetical protein